MNIDVLFLRVFTLNIAIRLSGSLGNCCRTHKGHSRPVSGCSSGNGNRAIPFVTGRETGTSAISGSMRLNASASCRMIVLDTRTRGGLIRSEYSSELSARLNGRHIDRKKPASTARQVQPACVEQIRTVPQQGEASASPCKTTRVKLPETQNGISSSRSLPPGASHPPGEAGALLRGAAAPPPAIRREPPELPPKPPPASEPPP